LANTAQAKKRARQAEKHRQHNASLRSQLRTSLKKVHTAIASSDKNVANASFKEAQPIIDKMVTKGIIHKNKAARHKSRLNAQIKGIAS
jgi:small subunit ribosomal protein S20